MDSWSVEERVEHLKKEHFRRFGPSDAVQQVVIAPYRICPLGAHVDHQFGFVTGMALQHCIILVFTPNPEPEVNLESLNFPGFKSFTLNGSFQRGRDWGDYARGAAMALMRSSKLKTGFDGILEGNMPLGGLSSSAAVGVAYLVALQTVNGFQVTPKENVELDRIIENEFIGLGNGILDQSVILLSEPGRLLFLDCLDGSSEKLQPSPGMAPFDIVVAYSGIERSLVDTDYNIRVHECEAAAYELLKHAGKPIPDHGPVKLRQASPVDYQRFGKALPARLRRRAEHFFSECWRVQRGIHAWRSGDLEGFGRLMQESGRSSVKNYECGCPPLVSLMDILNQSPGIHGARFSGGGFRGSCIALSDPRRREEIRETVTRSYAERHPNFANQFEIHFCRDGAGARLL